jgi:membrane-bound lytic murein transglycosylase D
MMWIRLVAVALLFLSAGVAGAESDRALEPRRRSVGLPASLPAPEALRPQIEFWKKVFAVYGDDQTVIHDSRDLGRIYRVLDFGHLAEAGFRSGMIQKMREDTVAAEKEYIRTVLIRIHQTGGDPSRLGEEERRIARLFEGAPRGTVLEAAEMERIRAQRGIKERFGHGIAVSRRYLPDLERIFREEGVPEAMTRLALVESCFNVSAYSKVGAAGVWQFIPATGKLFMRVDNHIDERRDPLIAGRAAARFLRRSYDKLGTWPLAITGYNHGPQGVANAVDAMGTRDIVAIIEGYAGSRFGFASRNFYPELIAAVEVDAGYRDYFPDLVPYRPIATEWVRFGSPLSFRNALRVTELDRGTFLDLNPAMGESIRANRVPIPGGYALRVPAGRAARAEVRFASLPKARKEPPKAAAGGRQYVVHKVRKGQTLTQIARRYGTTVARIKVANRLPRSGLIRVGQRLRVPTG